LHNRNIMLIFVPNQLKINSMSLQTKEIEPTIDEVIEEITTNESYIPNIKEILVIYFNEHPKAKAEWIAWLGGK